MEAIKHLNKVSGQQWDELWLEEFKFSTNIDPYAKYRMTQCGLDELAYKLDHAKYKDTEYTIARIMTDWNKEIYLIEFESNPTCVPLQFKVSDFHKYFKIILTDEKIQRTKA